MLTKLRQGAQDGVIEITYSYLGHIKRDEDHKFLAHAEASAWSEVDPAIRGLLEQYLYQALEGEMGEVNFPCMYTGETLSVDKVASSEFDRTRNRASVEILEAIHELAVPTARAFVELGNSLAYKVMAAGAIKNHLVAILRFQIVPSLGAAPIRFVFATICDLDDREESLFDETRGRFVTQILNNVVKRGAVGRAVLFPCLDQDGRELADMLVYAGSGGGAWFSALEATRRLNPKREGQALVRMISEQSSGAEVSHDLFRRMGDHLLAQSNEGLNAQSVADGLEKAVGHGIDRRGFLSRWESSFGDLSYRPTYGSLFGAGENQSPTRLKMQAGEIQINMTPGHLEHFRQVSVNGKTFLLFEVPERAKVLVGKDLDLQIKPVSIGDLRAWLES